MAHDEHGQHGQHDEHGQHDQIVAARRHCERLARAHYENFPVASRLLPARVRPAVAAIYAYSRIADDYADEIRFAGRRLERLAEHEQALDAALGGRWSELPASADERVFRALADAAERFDLPVDALRDLIDAFRQDCTVSRYDSFADVLDYCRRSANPVGRLVLALHDVRDPASLRASDAICTGLQLTNFWQDVAIDLEKDRIYLPAEDRRRFGVTEDALFEHRADDAFRELMAFEIERTRELFADGHPLARETRGRLGLWLRLVWAGGHAILDRIEEVGCNVFTHRPVLCGRDWIGLALPALLGRTRPTPVRLEEPARGSAA